MRASLCRALLCKQPCRSSDWVTVTTMSYKNPHQSQPAVVENTPGMFTPCTEQKEIYTKKHTRRGSRQRKLYLLSTILTALNIYIISLQVRISVDVSELSNCFYTVCFGSAKVNVERQRSSIKHARTIILQQGCDLSPVCTGALPALFFWPWSRSRGLPARPPANLMGGLTFLSATASCHCSPFPPPSEIFQQPEPSVPPCASRANHISESNEPDTQWL